MDKVENTFLKRRQILSRDTEALAIILSQLCMFVSLLSGPLVTSPDTAMALFVTFGAIIHDLLSLPISTIEFRVS